MYLAIILLPLLGSISSGFFGRKIGVTGSQLITCTSDFLQGLLMRAYTWLINLPLEVCICFILISLLVVLIVLMTRFFNLDAARQFRLNHRNRFTNSRYCINLVHVWHPHLRRNQWFVYDENDRTGANLMLLLGNRHSNHQFLNGYRGVVFTVDNNDNPRQFSFVTVNGQLQFFLRVYASASSFRTVSSRFIILSGGFPIIHSTTGGRRNEWMFVHYHNAPTVFHPAHDLGIQLRIARGAWQ